MKSLRLGVNIDHVATLRNARGGDNPDPIRAALMAQAAGADGITAHLREDRHPWVRGALLVIIAAATIAGLFSQYAAAVRERSVRRPITA